MLNIRDSITLAVTKVIHVTSEGIDLVSSGDLGTMENSCLRIILNED